MTTTLILLGVVVWLVGAVCGVMATAIWVGWTHRQHEKETLSMSRRREGYKAVDGNGQTTW